MIKELDDEYELTVDNMVPMTQDQCNNEYSLYDSEFYNKHGKRVTMSILLSRDGNRQIFQMKDGKFIEETVKPQGDVGYRWSNDLLDLI